MLCVLVMCVSCLFPTFTGLCSLARVLVLPWPTLLINIQHDINLVLAHVSIAANMSLMNTSLNLLLLVQSAIIFMIEKLEYHPLFSSVSLPMCYYLLISCNSCLS